VVLEFRYGDGYAVYCRSSIWGLCCVCLSEEGRQMKRLVVFAIIASVIAFFWFVLIPAIFTMFGPRM